MENKYKEQYYNIKKDRRENKRIEKRKLNGEEVIFIFEKVLEKWPTIKIYNVIKQNNPNTILNKQKTEVIATGNCKVYESELTKDRYHYYCQLRNKIYELNNKNQVKII